MDRLEEGQVNRWGSQWARHSAYLPVHRNQLSRWLGFSSIEGLKEYAGKSVLDAGCGMGRNSLTLLEAGAKRVIAVDGSIECVQVTRENLRDHLDKLKVARVDLYQLSEWFGDSGENPVDRVICIGVLHHLEKPELAVRQLLGVMARDGEATIWVYGSQSRASRIAVQLRGLTGPIRGSAGLVWTLARVIAFFAKIFAALGILRGDYWELLRSTSARHFSEIFYDQLHPEIANYWTENQFRAVLEAGGAVIKELREVNGNSWVARIRAG